MEDHAGGKKRDGESDGRQQPRLVLMSGNRTERVSKVAIKSIEFKVEVLKSIM